MEIDNIFNEKICSNYFFEVSVGQYPDGAWDFGYDYQIGTAGGGCCICEECRGIDYITKHDAIEAGLRRIEEIALYEQSITPTESPKSKKIKKYIDIVQRCIKSLNYPKQLELF